MVATETIHLPIFPKVSQLKMVQKAVLVCDDTTWKALTIAFLILLATSATPCPIFLPKFIAA